RGDVIVLHDPGNPNQDFIKRVIGLPGEKVEIKKGRVYANGELLDEPYIAEFCTNGCDGSWEIKAGQYFVLGDNRAHSYDGHSCGPVNRSLIVGQAWIRYWPLSDIGVIQHPRYASKLPGIGQIQPTRTPKPKKPTPKPTLPNIGSGLPDA